jgi:hypothetical protein
LPPLLAELLFWAKAPKVRQSAMSAGEIMDTRIDDIRLISPFEKTLV